MWSCRYHAIQSAFRRPYSTKTTLSHRIFRDDRNASNLDQSKYNTAVILHGILGNKLNWRTFASKLAQAFPTWQFIPVDLRGHGDSLSYAEPHSVQACAKDVMSLTDEIGVRPQAIIGHSFGGKVALSLLELCKFEGRSYPKQSWILDVLPGAREQCEVQQSLNSSVDKVLEILTSIQLPIHSKGELIKELQVRGLDISLAQWLSTNLRVMPHNPEQYEWKMDIPVVEKLFESFRTLDLWPTLSDPSLCANNAEVHFVQAEKNKMWTSEVIKRFETVKPNGVYRHVLPKAGHWVHVDNSNGLFQILQRHWPV